MCMLGIEPLLRALGIFIFSYFFLIFLIQNCRALKFMEEGRRVMALSVSLIKTVLRKQNILIPWVDKKDNRESG